MRINDIPKMTSSGDYQSSSNLVYFVNRIEEYIEEYGLQLNPDFQRGHVWTDKQQIEFIEYLLRGGKSGTVVYLNHPNWMGSFAEEDDNPFVVVDGLQRITAIRRFIKDEIPAFGKLLSEYENGLVDLRRSTSITMDININNLKTRKEVLQWYLEMNSGGTPHSQEELNRVEELLKVYE